MKRQHLAIVLAVMWVASSALAGAREIQRGPDQPKLVRVEVDWSATVGQSRTDLTLQVCPEPPMLRGGPIHRQAHEALRDLKMSYVRLQPWFPYPRLSIAALEPPGNGKTSWDFSLLDPIMLDFYAAAEGRPIVYNPAIPRWLFKAPPHRYPDDPHEIDWKYEFGPPIGSVEEVGNELRDPSYQEVADYFRRIAEWYIRGGFVDEYGKAYRSGHRLKIDVWDVLNEQEVDIGHSLTPEVYTALYDKVVSELRAVDPAMKFSGLSMADIKDLHYFEYFLNPKNHQPGIPLDMVSYHKYIVARVGRTLPEWQQDMFSQVDEFLTFVRNVERIRQRLSPTTKTFLSEFGIVWGQEMANTFAVLIGGKVDYSDPKIPEAYWTLGASAFAYGYLGAIREGVDLVGASELVNYPGQHAGTNLIHWRTGAPNAVYRVVKLLHEELSPGDRLLKTHVNGPDPLRPIDRLYKTDLTGVAAQAFATSQGRKLLLINKTHEQRRVEVPGLAGATAQTVDMTTKDQAPRTDRLTGGHLLLQPQAVAILMWPQAH